MFRKRALSAFFAIEILISIMNPSSAYAEDIPKIFSFTGSGYGHGVGMSQIGARGQALEGRSALEILGYYYPGTQVQSVSDSQTIRVNIGHLLNQITVSMVNGSSSLGNGEFSLLSGDGQLIGTYGRDITATFTLVTGIVIPQLTSPAAKFAPLKGDSLFTISWTPDSVIRIGNETATTTSQFKYGTISIKVVPTVAGPKLEIVNTLRLHDEYLWGIGEVPSSWPAAALEAQAIASRTYALTKISSIRKECDCNVYNTIADQNFVGFSKESEPIYGQLWKSAVNRTSTDSTSGLVVTFNGKPANTYFFSSSAGSTLDVRDVWGGTFPYLISVPDTWSVSMELNPRYYTWNREITQTMMAAAFNLSDIVKYQVLSRGNTGNVTSIQGISSKGKKAKLTGETFRSRVKLPSTWFGLTSTITPIEQSDLCNVVIRRSWGAFALC